jgi:hypothetical protein
MDKERMTETALESLTTYFTNQTELVEYRRKLVAAFDEDELRTLCFDIGIDFEMLPGAHKGVKVIELISYCLRRGRLFDLLAYCAEVRPNLFTKPDPANFTESTQAKLNQTDEVYKTVAHHFAADSFADQALQRFAEQPAADSRRTILQAMLREQLEADPEFVRALQDALPDKGASGDIITQTVTLQDNSSAGNISLIGKVEGAASNESGKN